ncbi:MAG: bifunctional metallophosphatase/5'-nucleotidase [Bacteroidales bacterium]|nr:bifunctional metallophosphatase/5'-nucleotidase [Candidatus Liminaster caballi]
MKRLKYLLLCLLSLACSLSMADTIGKDDVVVLFDNDVHGHVQGYPKIAALKDEMLRITPYVSLVSLGDFAQGGSLNSVSHGQYAIDIMNRAGYDLVTLGNHEFDYGLEQLDLLTSSLNARTLVCNYRDLRTNTLPYKPYSIRQFGNLKVGFIGALAPVTKTSDSPQSFVDADGNDIFTFGRPDFYSVVQKYVDEVRGLGADVVVLLAHLGDNDFFTETSEETIRQTHGINVVLDGHAHHVIPARYIADQKGDSVLLASSGAHFENMGRLVIHPDGKCTTDLIPVADYHRERLSVSLTIESFQETFRHLPAIATCEFDLVAFDKEHNTYDRAMQTNLGSLCSDAFRILSKSDIGWINAGGLRASIPSGKITFSELLAALPFENSICVAEFTGRQIVDALEFGVCHAPEDNGSYPQVSGLLFDLNLNVTANIVTDDAGNLIRVENGPRRVTNVRVLNSNSGLYEAIDPDKTYSVASIDFILKHRGCNAMLENGHLIKDDQMIDTQLIEIFFSEHLNGVIGSKYSTKVVDMSR